MVTPTTGIVDIERITENGIQLMPSPPHAASTLENENYMRAVQRALVKEPLEYTSSKKDPNPKKCNLPCAHVGDQEFEPVPADTGCVVQLCTCPGR